MNVVNDICAEDVCASLAHSRGWCKRHYRLVYLKSEEARRESTLRAERRQRELATGLRVCDRCTAEKPMADFTPSKMHASGRLPTCKPCRNVAARKRDRGYAPRVRTAEIDRHRARQGWLKKKYGITLADYDEMFARQAGRCAVCGKAKKLVVDHCHASGRVRDLLCHGCNAALGFAEEDPAVLLGLIKYVELHNAWKATA